MYTAGSMLVGRSLWTTWLLSRTCRIQNGGVPLGQECLSRHHQVLHTYMAYKWSVLWLHSLDTDPLMSYELRGSLTSTSLLSLFPGREWRLWTATVHTLREDSTWFWKSWLSLLPCDDTRMRHSFRICQESWVLLWPWLEVLLPPGLPRVWSRARGLACRYNGCTARYW